MLTSCDHVEKIYQKLSIQNDCKFEKLMLGAIFQFVYYDKLNVEKVSVFDLKSLFEKFEGIIVTAKLADSKNKHVCDSSSINFVISQCVDTINYSCATESLIHYISAKWEKECQLINRKNYQYLLSALVTKPELKSMVFQLSWDISVIFNSQKYHEKFKFYLWDTICSYIIFSDVLKKNPECISVSLNPYHSMDLGMILACQDFKNKVWFMPHGLPQKSMYLHTFDYVTPLTLIDPQWRRFRAKPIYLPWSESRGLYPRESNQKISCKNIKILFFSQFSGSDLHQMDTLVDSSFEVINKLILRSDISTITIRLRHEDEESKYLPLLDCSKISISYANKTSVSVDIRGNDILAACSSTALLYGQTYNKPVIQILDSTIERIWPYYLTSEERIINVAFNISSQLNHALTDIYEKPFNTKILYKGVVSDYKNLFEDSN